MYVKETLTNIHAQYGSFFEYVSFYTQKGDFKSVLKSIMGILRGFIIVFLSVMETAKKIETFGNGRYARNMFMTTQIFIYIILLTFYHMGTFYYFSKLPSTSHKFLVAFF